MKNVWVFILPAFAVVVYNVAIAIAHANGIEGWGAIGLAYAVGVPILAAAFWGKTLIDKKKLGR